MNILKLFSQISTFVFDIDGVLTDGSLYLLQDGILARRMNIKDGYALQLAIKKGYRIIIISGAFSEEVNFRLQKLGITEVLMKVTDKKRVLSEYVAVNQLDWKKMLYMGDDIPDLSVMGEVLLPCCPADAVPEIKVISKYISSIKGGNGCARDVIEKVLKLNDHWEINTGIVSM